MTHKGGEDNQLTAVDRKERLMRFKKHGVMTEKTNRKELKKTYILSEKDTEIASKKIKNSNMLYHIVMILCCTLIAIGIGIELWYVSDTTKSSNSLQSLASEFAVPEVASGVPEKDMSMLPPLVDFDGLKNINPDVSGWLKIPDTTVDYPIMSSDNQDKYLFTDYEGNYSISGSLFTDFQNTPDYSQEHIIIYGHHMNASVMFHDVSYYTDPNFFMNHRKIYLSTPDTTYVLKPVGSYIADANEYMARQVNFGNSNDFQSYLDERLARCDYINEQDSERRVLDKLITLVTCTNTGDSRVVVECVVTEAYPSEYVQNVIANS